LASSVLRDTIARRMRRCCWRERLCSRRGSSVLRLRRVAKTRDKAARRPDNFLCNRRFLFARRNNEMNACTGWFSCEARGVAQRKTIDAKSWAERVCRVATPPNHTAASRSPWSPSASGRRPIRRPSSQGPHTTHFPPTASISAFNPVHTNGANTRTCIEKNDVPEGSKGFIPQRC
jgi:hypothetical protein